MKRFFILPLLGLFLSSALAASAQDKLKEGKLSFEITYPEADDMNDQMLAMMPKDATVWFKEGKSRTETKMAYGSYIIISDSKETVVCMDMMGKKNATKISAEEAEKEKEKNIGEYEVDITKETKKIAGYECKKAIINFSNGEDPLEVWFTDKLAASNNSNATWKGIDGVLMEHTVEQKSAMGSIKMKMTCTKIEKVTVEDDKFNIPEGFTVMTKDELMKQYSK